MSYTGGKGGPGVYHTIINQMPPHRVYVEAFLGAGAVLRAKRPAVASIGIDADGDVLRGHWRGDEVPGLQLINANAIEWLAAYPWRGDELVYCDPPYLMETRSSQRAYYRCELATADEHQALLAILRRLPVPVLISGYWSELYAGELSGWRSLSFTTTTRGNGKATEWLWCNFPEPVELHDYRYLGRNFRERERITRKARRWRNRLGRMSTLERRALLWAMQDAWGPIANPGDAHVLTAESDDGAGGIVRNGVPRATPNLTMRAAPIAESSDVVEAIATNGEIGHPGDPPSLELASGAPIGKNGDGGRPG